MFTAIIALALAQTPQAPPVKGCLCIIGEPCTCHLHLSWDGRANGCKCNTDYTRCTCKDCPGKLRAPAQAPPLKWCGCQLGAKCICLVNTRLGCACEGCVCKDCPGKASKVPAESYEALSAKAVREGKTLWVCVNCRPVVPAGVIACYRDAWETKTPRVIVSVPDGHGGLTWTETRSPSGAPVQSVISNGAIYYQAPTQSRSC